MYDETETDEWADMFLDTLPEIAEEVKPVNLITIRRRVLLSPHSRRIAAQNERLQGLLIRKEEELASLKESPKKPSIPLPRKEDYIVDCKELAGMLAMADVPKSARQIERWDNYLRSAGMSGTQPPQGYNLNTRLTLEAAHAWVKSYAARETSKLKVKVGFDERYHRRH